MRVYAGAIGRKEGVRRSRKRDKVQGDGEGRNHHEETAKSSIDINGGLCQRLTSWQEALCRDEGNGMTESGALFVVGRDDDYCKCFDAQS